jgi:hypothetical protein
MEDLNDYSNEDYENYSNENEDFKDEDYAYNDYLNFKKSIIYLDEPLRYIVNNIEINVVYGNIKINLLDYLPLFKKGYTTRDNLQHIFVIYQYLHNIEPYTNPLYIEAFGKNIPENYIDFFQNYIDFFQNYKEDDVDTSGIFLEDSLIKELHDNYINYDINKNDDIKLEDFILYNSSQDWDELLLSSILRLHTAIIKNSKYEVEEFLNEIDPRNDNNEVYHLAVKIGNNKIIKLVKNKIIELNWLDKQVLIKEFNKYNFLNDDIIQYFQSRKY